MYNIGDLSIVKATLVLWQNQTDYVSNYKVAEDNINEVYSKYFTAFDYG